MPGLQIRGFGEYGFPESHAASFALIAYATAWMRRHHLDVFVCSLLNAQPMGFYSAATLLEDVKRHRLEVRPVDVTRSDWDCGLEAVERRASSVERANGGSSPLGSPFAVRMGLRYAKSLSESDGRCIEAERRARAFASVEDFVRRTGLDEGTVARLAGAGAVAL